MKFDLLIIRRHLFPLSNFHSLPQFGCSILKGFFAFLHFSFQRKFVTYLIFKWKVNVVESELFPHFIRLRRHHQLIVPEKSILKKFEFEISRNSNWISWQRKNCCEYQFDGDHFRNARGCEERGGKRNDKFGKRKEGIHRNRLKTLQEWAFSTLCSFSKRMVGAVENRKMINYAKI